MTHQEWCIVQLDRNGSVIFRKSSGAKNYVQFTPSQLEKMKDRVLTHNHPSGSTFSSEDVILMAAHELKGIRAAGKTKTYQLSKKSNSQGNVLAADYKVAMSDNKKITDAKYRKMQKDFKKGRIDYQEYSEMLQTLNEELNQLNSDWLKENAKSYGYRYSVIERR